MEPPILRKALTDAMRDELVKRNVAALVEPPAVRRDPAQPPTLAEMKALLAAAADDRLATFWLLVLALGLRRGEGATVAKSPILGVRLPGDLKPWLEHRAEKEGGTPTDLIRRLIEQYRADVEGVSRVATSTATR